MEISGLGDRLGRKGLSCSEPTRVPKKTVSRSTEMPPNWALAANPPCQFLRVLESKLKKKKKGRGS